MQENEFEKQVREKMTELGFDPSDSVWSRVEKEINPERKRRRPLFWLFFLSGILLAGAGYYITGRNGLQQHPLSETSKKAQSESATASADENKNRKSGTGHIKIESLQNNSESPNRKTEMANKSVPSKKQAVSSASGSADENYAASPVVSSKTAGNSVATTGDNVNQTHSVSSQDSMKPDLTAVKNKTADSAAITKTKSKPVAASNDSTAAKTVNSKKKSSWQFGLTAGGGVSNVNQGLFKSASVAVGSNLSAAVPAGALGGGFYGAPAFHSGFSFGTGTFAKRNLSARFSISGGLEYHYYSNKINTGNQLLNTSALPPAWLSNYNASAYYQFGNNKVYTNQYHFLQIPFYAGLQLNKNPRHPITWEAGLSPSWLLASSALQFDASNGILYKNSQNLNRFQLNAGTSLLIGIPGKRALWQAGPEIQYGLTGLSNAASGNSQHLLYYGLKVNFIPLKK